MSQMRYELMTTERPFIVYDSKLCTTRLIEVDGLERAKEYVEVANVIDGIRVHRKESDAA
jgi:hypothetical protein